MAAALAFCAAGEIPPPWQEAVGPISAASLRGHVFFLASDLLEGRDTPSRGLDLAAEYIASQFRRAGLDPAGGDTYFQTGPASQDGADLPPAQNVAALLLGSDPLLRETAIILSAHYDHLGLKPDGDGDRIFNGANDDASGTAAVIEIAQALASLPIRPKRTILFIAFYGEERGMLGSNHYVEHPLWPLDRTVANLNLEHLGRTDSTEGPQLRRASVTGFDYSDIGDIVRQIGALTGIAVHHHPENSDKFFPQSDNIVFARQGIPAHSICAAFLYPDYHTPADHWDKLDYENMATLTRMIALALLTLAEHDQPPRWNEHSEQAAPFRERAVRR